MFATMLHLPKSYLWLPEKWYSIIPVVLMFMNIFSPVISFMTFHFHFDEHLVECQHHRNHTEDCQASCILQEVMPEQSEAIPGKTVSLSHLFSDLFFQNHPLIPAVLLNKVLTVNLFSHHLLLYSSPFLSIHSPPPELHPFVFQPLSV